MATDYDKGTVTAREKLAGSRQNALAKYNAQSLLNQLNYQLKNYDLADKQNASLRDVQYKQNMRKAETDRFEAQRNLQNAALGLFGSMNQAMNGSTVGNAMKMLADRNDAENDIYWQQLMDNQNQVKNAYQESLNQNQAARYDAISNARKGLRDIQSDLAANLNNINPNLYKAPGSNKDVDKIQQQVAKKQSATTAKNASLSGYIMPANAEQTVRRKNQSTGKYADNLGRNKLLGGDYYDKLINRFNGR